MRTLRARYRSFRDPRLDAHYAVIVINMFLVVSLLDSPGLRARHRLPAMQSGLIVSCHRGALLIQPLAGVLADHARCARRYCWTAGRCTEHYGDHITSGFRL